MNIATFDRIIKQPASITPDEAKQLEGLVQEFPYCQMAHLLIASESFRKKSMNYPKKLRKASTYILNRSVLHALIHYKSEETILSPEAEKNNNVLQQETAPAENQNPVTERTTAEDVFKEIEVNLEKLRENKAGYLKSSSTNLTLSPDSGLKPVFRFRKFTGHDGFGEEISTTRTENLDLLLNYLQKNSAEIKETGLNQSDIIDRFIESQPKLQVASPLTHIAGDTKDLAKPSTELKLELITENFALILTKQNKIEKAIEVYKKLMLKYPNKSAYFAGKLNELESI